MTARVTGGQAVVRTLEAMGVRVVFGIPGVHTLEIYDALVDSPIRHILARHEQGAGFMADGYARVSSEPGVALVITGPGVTNVLTAIGEAYTDSSPVLVISSNVERQWAGQMLGHLHDLKDQLGVMAAVTKWNRQAVRVEQVPELIAAAFQQMASGRTRPTHVEIPLDVLSSHGAFEPPRRLVPERPEPDHGQIRAAKEALESARRVVIWAGGGAVSANAGAAIASLAERLCAPILTSVMGKGAVPDDHPYVLGSLWRAGNSADYLLRAADTAIVVGSKLGAQDTDTQRLPLPAVIIRIDSDPEEIGRNYAPSHPIVADARLACETLLEAMQGSRPPGSGWTAEEVQVAKKQALAGAFGADQQPYLDALRAAIPRDGIVVSDMTMMGYAALERFPVYEPRTFLFPQGYGTLGFALPAAIGARIARPDRVVVPIVGDGGFQFTMQELATAIQFNVGLPIVIFNDSTYTAVKEAQARTRDRRFVAVDLVNPDFLKLGDAYGIPAVRAASPDALHDAIVAARDRMVPTIIDTPIHFEV